MAAWREFPSAELLVSGLGVALPALAGPLTGSEASGRASHDRAHDGSCPQVHPVDAGEGGSPQIDVADIDPGAVEGMPESPMRRFGMISGPPGA